MAEKRNYGVDALRILAMYMIVVLHVLGQGGDSGCGAARNGAVFCGMAYGNCFVLCGELLRIDFWLCGRKVQLQNVKHTVFVASGCVLWPFGVLGFERGNAPKHTELCVETGGYSCKQ